jgi:hypothetical protein
LLVDLPRLHRVHLSIPTRVVWLDAPLSQQERAKFKLRHYPVSTLLFEEPAILLFLNAGMHLPFKNLLQQQHQPSLAVLICAIVEV